MKKSEVVNFPISYDTLGEFLYFIEQGEPELRMEESTATKGLMKLKIGVNGKLVSMQLLQGERSSGVTITLSQYKLLLESMKVVWCVYLCVFSKAYPS
jgi:hypothetical protein